MVKASFRPAIFGTITSFDAWRTGIYTVKPVSLPRWMRYRVENKPDPIGKGTGPLEKPFWKRKTLREMTTEEWESLCDGCGRCCLNKLEGWDTAEIYYTSIACSELDCDSCRCKSYEFRFDVVPDCIDLTPEKVEAINWLPPTCGYRLIKEGRDLYPWHPLVSGNPNSVHDAGISVRGRVVSETGLTPEDYEDYLVDWPEKGV